MDASTDGKQWKTYGKQWKTTVNEIACRKYVDHGGKMGCMNMARNANIMKINHFPHVGGVCVC